MIVNARLARRNRWIGLLDRGRLRRVQDVAAGELPVLVALSCRIDEFIRAGVFDVALVNDETNVLGSRSDAHIEECAKAVLPRHLHRPAIEVRSVFSGVTEGIDSPAQIVSVRTEIM